MRHKVFDKKFKLPFLVTFPTLLVLAIILNVVKNTTLIFAETKYKIAIVDVNNATIGTPVEIEASKMYRDASDPEEGFYVAVDTDCSGGERCIISITNWDEEVLNSIRVDDINRVIPGYPNYLYTSFKLQVRDANNGLIREETLDGTGTISWNYNPDDGSYSTIGTSDPFDQETTTAEEITESIETTDQQDQDGQAITDQQDTDTEEQPTPAGEEISCSNAAKGLGWILCTVADLGSNMLGGLYSAMENLLIVNTDAISTKDSEGNESGVHQIWGYFRDIANVIFVILLLIVILSQVTGVGIDNYGIKKILPRLIVVAIIVNLSFFVCQFFIDISNIVGSSIGDFIGSIEIKINNSANFGDYVFGSAGVLGLLGLGFAGLAIAGGGIGGSALLSGLTAALIGFLSVLVSAICAVLFMIFLLGARLGVIVLGVVVSPLAIALSILPNTKSVYERWLKIMKGMLLLYPICSFTIVGGSLASKVILSINNGNSGFLMVIIAVIVQIAPFFLVPSLVRGSFNAIGKIGTQLAGFGRGFGRGARERVRNSNTMRYAQQRVQNRRANTTIQRFRKRYGNASGSIAPPSSKIGRAMYGVRNMGYQQAQQISGANIGQLSTMYKDSDKATVSNELNDALKKLDPQRFVAAFRDLLQKGGREDALNALYNNAAVMNDPTMRAAVEREMGGSGDTFMKEYAKWKATTPTSAGKNFKDFVDSGALTAQLNAKGETALANADKDVYAFMATIASRNKAAFSGLDNSVLARAATSLTASDQATKFNTFIANMDYDDSKQDKIVKKISIAQSATMFDSTRRALSSAASGTNDNARVKSRFNTQFNELRTNPNNYASILAQMDNDDRTNYI